jgi:Contractile injection system tube protein
MASELPTAPLVLKGALVVFGASVPIPTNLIVFQYNPDGMSRAYRASASTAAEGEQARAGGTRRVRPPVETFTISVELDAADQLETSNPVTATFGVHPALAALELLLFPDSTVVILNKVLAAAGMSLIAQPKTPVVLLVWGVTRIVPVRVTSVSVTEQAYDQALNPIRAKVDLGLQALTESELREAGAPFDTLGLVNQIAKEVLAKLNTVSGALEVTAEISF